MFAIVRSLCSGWQSVRPMIFRYGSRDSRKSNTRHTGPVCESKTQFNDVHSRYQSTPFICSVRFFLDTIRAKRPLRFKTNDGIVIAGRWCHSSAHQKCWGDWAPEGAYHLDGKPGCSSWKIKWLPPFRLRSFRKHGLWFEAMQFFYSFQSFHLVWICFVTDRSPTTSNFIVLCLCTTFFENGNSGSCCWDFWDLIVTNIGLLVPLRQSSIPRKILGLMAGA